MTPLEPYIADADFTLYQGDVLEVLAGLPAESVHCCVTSPPYWGLRDYGTGSWEGGDDGCDHETVAARNGRGGSGSPGKQTVGSFPSEFAASECGKCGARRVDHQLGLEPTPEEYVANMVAVFREVRRVLRRDGTCWLNIGDSYGSGTTADRGPTSTQGPDVPASWSNRSQAPRNGLKPKDLVGIPWRLAFALQADGWYLRSDIIWSKPNPMPESVTDRPTKAHEYLFLLTKSARYFYDADAIREQATWDRWSSKQTTPKHTKNGNARYAAMGREWTEEELARYCESGRNRRSVWEIATQPYPDAHFATFPTKLIEPCILAGTSDRGCCPVCGAPWERETEKSLEGGHFVPNARPAVADGSRVATTGAYAGARLVSASYKVETTGWRPTCEHDHEPVAAVVLDPFSGSGTTALVARRHGRRSIGVELNPDYCALTARRLQQLSLLAA